MTLIEHSLKIIEQNAKEQRKALGFMGNYTYINQREMHLKNKILILLVIEEVRLN